MIAVKALESLHNPRSTRLLWEMVGIFDPAQTLPPFPQILNHLQISLEADISRIILVVVVVAD